MTLKEKIAIMQAFDDGAVIQGTPCDCYSLWQDEAYPDWDWFRYEYRVKPKLLEYWAIVSMSTNVCLGVYLTMQEAKEKSLVYDSDHIRIVKLAEEK